MTYIKYHLLIIRPLSLYLKTSYISNVIGITLAFISPPFTHQSEGEDVSLLAEM